jgi:hypothetical protein
VTGSSVNGSHLSPPPFSPTRQSTSISRATRRAFNSFLAPDLHNGSAATSSGLVPPWSIYGRRCRPSAKRLARKRSRVMSPMLAIGTKRRSARSVESPTPVRPMPSSVQARRVRIRAMPTAVIAAPCLGLYAVRLRARGLGQVPTGLRRRNARAAHECDRKHNDAENLPHRGLLRLLFPRQRPNSLDPRLRQRTARAAVPSIDRFRARN